MADGLLPTRRGWLGLRWIDVALAAARAAGGRAAVVPGDGRRHGIAYLRRFFVGENLERFATDRYNGRRPLWFYVPIILGGLAPWSSLIVLWIPTLGRVLRGVRRLTEPSGALILWAAVPFVFYTLSVGQQPRYILPVLPPLALLVARTLLSRLDASEAAGPARTWPSPRRSRCSALALPRARLPAATARGRCSSRCRRCRARSARRSSSSPALAAARLDVVRPPTPAAGRRRGRGHGDAASAAVSRSTPRPASSRCS